MACINDFQSSNPASACQRITQDDSFNCSENDLSLKKKLFEDDDDDERCITPAEDKGQSPRLTSTACGFGGNLLFQFNSEESPVCTPLNETSGMEWDLQLATPCKTDERQKKGMRRSLDTSDSENMFISPPSKHPRNVHPEWSDESSPINSGLQQLRLFDTPHTPKSIVRRSSMQQSPADLFTQCKQTRSRLTFLLEQSSHEEKPVSRSATLLKRQKSRGTNVNPFTPQELQSKSRTSNTRQPSSMFHRPSSKKGLTLRENNISRYNAEFHEVSKIGCGQFGTVYKCINRLDGCTYAVKKSRKPVAGSADEAAAMREVYAHAVIGSHEHIVRYYSAWAEDNHMIIQNEFCNGGNLADKLLDCVARGTRLTERELIHLMKQVAKGLQYIHSKGLVHLDIKPENIFLCYHESSSFSSQSDSGICCTPEDSRDEDRPMDSPTLPVYKIGDMGHVTSVSNPSVEEGDCRFLPKELLNNKYEDLPKADIFSLGLTVYTLATLQDLPKNGEEWHHLRDGHLMPLTFLSTSHNRLLQAMAHPDPKMRPTSREVLSHQLLSSDEEKSRAELQKELQLEKMKNMSLQKELSRKQESSNDFHRRRFIRYSSSVF